MHVVRACRVAGVARLGDDGHLLEGPEAPELNLRLFRIMQARPSGPLWWYGQELDQTAFLEQMRSEQRLIYQFEVERSYGPRL